MILIVKKYLNIFLRSKFKQVELKGVKMAVIHIRKDGTVVDDISKVTVPKEIVEAVAAIASRERRNNEKED